MIKVVKMKLSENGIRNLKKKTFYERLLKALMAKNGNQSIVTAEAEFMTM